MISKLRYMYLLIVLLLLSSCIETGHRISDDTKIYVDIDNPALTSVATLHDVNTQWNGIMPQEIFVEGQSWQFVNSDFKVVASGGDDSPSANGIAKGGSIKDELYPQPGPEGHLGDQDSHSVFFNTLGLRVGYVPLKVDLVEIAPNHSRNVVDAPTNSKTIALDPKVILIPIQVAVFHSANIPQADARLPRQLAFWDRIPPTFGNLSTITDGQFGEIRYANRSFERIANNTRPDEIWKACSIQFRLINYYEIETDDFHVAPTRHPGEEIADDAPISQNISTAKDDPKFMPDIPLFVSMRRCSFSDAPEVGFGSARLLAACAPNKDDMIAAHELGHMLGLRDIRDCSGNDTDNLMCDVPSGTQLNADQCAIARRSADRFKTAFKHP